MKNFQTTAAPGLFDVDFRLQWLVAKGNPLSRLDAVVDWELFRPLLDETLDKPAQGNPADGVLGAAARHGDDDRAEADGKALDSHAGPLGHKEVPQFVNEDGKSEKKDRAECADAVRQ